MKKSFKLLALILALVMLVAVFAACDGGKGNGDETTAGDETTDGNGAETAVTPNVEKNRRTYFMGNAKKRYR